MVPPTLERDLKEWIKPVKGATFSIEVYPGVGHGFAARPDAQNSIIKEQYERAYQKKRWNFSHNIPYDDRLKLFSTCVLILARICS